MPIPTQMDTLARLEQTILERRAASPDASYVASLVARGLPVIARKLGDRYGDNAPEGAPPALTVEEAERLLPVDDEPTDEPVDEPAGTAA